jgi:hypothetical protein
MIIFNCDINQLTSLDVTGCTALFQLYCYNNKIKGEGMTTLVSSLETPANGGYMVMIDLESETEENEMTDDQIAAAKAKRWSVEAFIDGGYVSYPYEKHPISTTVSIGVSTYQRFPAWAANRYQSADWYDYPTKEMVYQGQGIGF